MGVIDKIVFYMGNVNLIGAHLYFLEYIHTKYVCKISKQYFL